MLSLLLTLVVGFYAFILFVKFCLWMLTELENFIKDLFPSDEQKAKKAADIKKQQEFDKLTPQQQIQYYRDQEKKRNSWVDYSSLSD